MERIAHQPRTVVLVVEDEYLIRADAADILAAAGYEVLEAGDAEEALDLLAARRDISLIFTDVNLPGMNGLRLIAEVTARWPHIRVLVTSGHAAAAGVPAPFIDKPYQPRHVVASVRGLLGR